MIDTIGGQADAGQNVTVSVFAVDRRFPRCSVLGARCHPCLGSSGQRFGDFCHCDQLAEDSADGADATSGHQALAKTDVPAYRKLETDAAPVC